MKYTFDSRVRFSETDENGNLSLMGLMNYFQDVCTLQADDLGIGFDYLIPTHRAWILTSWQIIIERMPRLGEKVTAATWPYDFKSFFGLRNLSLQDAGGDMCAYANSVWILYDLEHNVPVRIGQDLLDAYTLSPKLEMDYAPRKLHLPPIHTELETFTIEHHHLDRNHHVNNAQYVQMALNHLPEDFTLRQIRVEYQLQAKLGDVVTIISATQPQPDPGTVSIGLLNPEGKPYAIVEFQA